MLELKNIHKRYHMGDTVISALKGVDLTIEDGDFLAIMGPSGSGKSTLMHVIGLLDVPDEGHYKIRGKEVAKLAEDELAILRRKTIGFIFQQFNLLPRMTAEENTTLPLIYSEGKMDVERGQEMLRKVGLEERATHRPNELSGGQQQRVAIARSLINRPSLILADEPTGNLDSASEKEILSILKQLNDSGITVVIVTHEEDIGNKARRLIRMRDGVIVSDQRLDQSQSQSQSQNIEIENEGKAVEVVVEVVNEKKIKSDNGIFKLHLDHLYQHLNQGIKTLAANKVRTALSMLGIMIGVASVVAMLALGRGAQKAIEDQLTSLGSNLLMVRPGAVKGAGGARAEVGATTRLTIEDAVAIKEKIANVNDTIPNQSGKGQITYANKNWSTTVKGVTPSYTRVKSAVPVVGRFFTEDENKKRSRVAVIGATVLRELFSNDNSIANPIGEMIKINKINFQIIGVLPEKGAAGFHDQDDVVIIPVLTAMYRVFGKNYVDSIDVEMSDSKKADTIIDDVTELMINRHKIPLSRRDDAFQIRNMVEIQEALSASTKTMTILLSAIAAISLLVGGIGIMNIMLVSVTERTKEIGLRKAIGAKRGDILLQFLIESVTVSLIGGIFGIILAWLIAFILSTFVGWATTITVSSIMLAFIFSASIGVIFGIYPAKKASMLAPIDALRYE
ncbi:MAG: ABC transporter permease [Oligoflexia bacterium]|nr:ABC transporter permease [Oligoflexia bacterium]